MSDNTIKKKKKQKQKILGNEKGGMKKFFFDRMPIGLFIGKAPEKSKEQSVFQRHYTYYIAKSTRGKSSDLVQPGERAGKWN